MSSELLSPRDNFRPVRAVEVLELAPIGEVGRDLRQAFLRWRFEDPAKAHQETLCYVVRGDLADPRNLTSNNAWIIAGFEAAKIHLDGESIGAPLEL